MFELLAFQARATETHSNDVLRRRLVVQALPNVSRTQRTPAHVLDTTPRPKVVERSSDLELSYARILATSP